MIIYVSSDWHLGPDGLRERHRAFLGRAEREGADCVVLNGDTLDLIPLGVKGYLDSPAARELNSWLDALPLVIIEGNHDPRDYLVRVLPRFSVRSSYEIGGFHFCHGHTRSDWRLLRYLAPGLTEWMVRHYPQEWYRLCRALGWLPSEAKARAMFSAREAERFVLMTLAIHDAWRRYMQGREVSTCIGHTHLAEVSHILNHDGRPLYLINSGDMKTDATYVVIREGTPQLRSWDEEGDLW